MNHRKLLIITFFAIAMGYLEGAVVVYLREIYYPGGFEFPLKTLTGRMAFTEIIREFATLAMLAGIGILAGKSRIQRFGIFIFAFGIWDIFYYIFLKLLICWPESLLTWDILFLIPVTWVGPVLAPVLNALTMCVLGAMIFYFDEKQESVTINRKEWLLLIIGSVIILISYTQDYLGFMRAHIPLADLFKPSKSEEVMGVFGGYIPERFNWWLFGSGQVLLLLAVVLFYRRYMPKSR